MWAGRIMSDTKAASVKKFNDVLFGVLDLIAKLSKTRTECEQAAHIRTKASIAVGCVESSVLWEAVPFLYKYQEQILGRDEKFLSDLSAGTLTSDGAVAGMFSSLRAIYFRSNAKTKDILYSECLKLNAAALTCAALCGPEEG